MVENSGQKKSRSLTYFSCPRVLFHPRGRRLSFLLFLFPFSFFSFFFLVSVEPEVSMKEKKKERKKGRKTAIESSYYAPSLPFKTVGHFETSFQEFPLSSFPLPLPSSRNASRARRHIERASSIRFFFPSSIFTPSSPLPPSNLSINPRLNPADV